MFSSNRKFRGESWDSIEIKKSEFNNNNNYDNHLSFDDFKIKALFDVIIVSFNWVKLLSNIYCPAFRGDLINDLKHYICGLSKNVSQKKFKYYPYKITAYIIKLGLNKKIKLSLIEHSWDTHKSLRLKIFQPDLQMLLFLNNLFVTFNAVVSEVEIAFDFHPIKPYKKKSREKELYHLFNKVACIGYISHRGLEEPRIRYKTTRYLNNVRRTSSKGAKVYIGPSRGPVNYVRLECTLKRRYLRKYPICTVNDLIGAKPEVLVKFFKFKTVNLSRLKKRFFDNNRGIPDTMQIYEYFWEIFEEKIVNVNLHSATKYMKIYTDKVPCLNDHPFNDIFHEWVKEQKFLK